MKVGWGSWMGWRIGSEIEWGGIHFPSCSCVNLSDMSFVH